MAIAEVLRATAGVTIRTTPERAFDAWLDPAIAVQFMCAGESDTATFENDPVEAGAYRLVMSGPSGANWEHVGRYVRIDRPRQLVFTWVSLGTQERLSLVTVTFTPVGDGVRVDLIHEGLPDDQAVREHAQGWAEILADQKTLQEA